MLACRSLRGDGELSASAVVAEVALEVEEPAPKVPERVASVVAASLGLMNEQNSAPPVAVETRTKGTESVVFVEPRP